MDTLKKIDVIGGSGFIGTRFIKRLMSLNESSIRIQDIRNSHEYSELVSSCDVRSIDQLSSCLRDGAVIVNLAAEHRDDVRPKKLYQEVNVEGARNICLVASEKKVRIIIFTSTVAVYGFAEPGTDESGAIAPFNEYGRTKYEAEQVFKNWQAEAPDERTLVIIRPTVVFGEQNRGNVYNLLRQIASGKFIMVGSGENRKSMAYVENVAAFIEHSITFKPGVYIYNFIDKPDFTMNQLVGRVKRNLGLPDKIRIRVPFTIGFMIGKGFDLVSSITGKQFTISSIRVRKFCANSVYNTAIEETGFVSPVPLGDALEKTIRHEFIESHEQEGVFYSE